MTALLLLFGVSISVTALGQNLPKSCDTGAFVTDLYNLSQTNRSFDADIWFWTVCPDDTRTPLKQMEYMNANRTIIGLDYTLKRGDAWWSSRKVSGTWRVDWNVSSYPFDRQTLKMVVEEGVDDTSTFVHVADIARSAVSPDIKIPGWKVTGFRLTGDARTYQTTFGDPTLDPAAGSKFSRLTIEVDIARDGLLSFLKLTAVVYVCSILTMLSFRLDSVTNFTDRFQLLVGTLFATVISMSVVNNTLGSDDQLTLIDLIHISCLLLIVASVVMTLISNYRSKRGVKATVLRTVDFYSMFGMAGLFLFINVVLISWALFSR